MMIINNYSNNNISFEALKFKKINEMQVPEIFKATNNETKDCFVKTNLKRKYFNLTVVDSKNKELGCSILNTLRERTFYNATIGSSTKNQGVGSIMHLTHIISMLENQIDKIELYSMGNAIFFHSKFKFEPDISSFEDITDFLVKEILLKRSKDTRFTKTISDTYNLFSNTSQKDKIEQGNKIIYDYLQTVNKLKLNNDDNFSIINGFDMVLTKDKVLQEKEYFNKLFKRFGIDYQI